MRRKDLKQARARESDAQFLHVCEKLSLLLSLVEPILRRQYGVEMDAFFGEARNAEEWGRDRLPDLLRFLQERERPGPVWEEAVRRAIGDGPL